MDVVQGLCGMIRLTCGAYRGFPLPTLRKSHKATVSLRCPCKLYMHASLHMFPGVWRILLAAACGLLPRLLQSRSMARPFSSRTSVCMERRGAKLPHFSHGGARALIFCSALVPSVAAAEQERSTFLCLVPLFMGNGSHELLNPTLPPCVLQWPYLCAISRRLRSRIGDLRDLQFPVL